ncbi:hypothetical protein BLA6992_04720 [Burkholderia lata]|nr:hypothetical protein BLA6992_04720 [Burkholderia lata]
MILLTLNCMASDLRILDFASQYTDLSTYAIYMSFCGSATM